MIGAEVVVLRPWVASKEVAPILVLEPTCLVSTGHMWSFDTVTLRESAKSALLVHVFVPTRLNVEAFGIKARLPCSLSGVHLFLEVLWHQLKLGQVCPHLGVKLSM